MGIKFYCPQGHKLHVKAFLAGKKGVCPHCGTKVRIPLESQRGGGRDSARDGGPDDDGPEPEESDISAEHPAPVAPVATSAPATHPAAAAARSGIGLAGSPAPVAAAPVAAAPVAPSPIAAAASAAAAPALAPARPNGQPAHPAAYPAPAAAPIAARPAPVAAPVGAPAGVPVGAPAGAPVAAAVAAPTSAPVADPLAEMPNAEWYVCPPTGGRFGPANGEVLRRWIGEGRVTSDSLVWRTGWSDWRAASSVLPSFGGLGRGAGPPPTPAAPVASGPAYSAPPAGYAPGPGPHAAAAPASTAALSGYSARRKSASAIGMMIVALLAVLSVALIGALVWVLRK